MKTGVLYLILSLILLGSIACNDENEASAPIPTTKITASPTPEPVLITIGDLTDITGPGANALSLITMVLEDMVTYYNQQNLIPGVQLEVISYDGQFDPAFHAHLLSISTQSHRPQIAVANGQRLERISTVTLILFD